MHVVIGLVVLFLGLFLASRATAKTKQSGDERYYLRRAWAGSLCLSCRFRFYNTMEDMMVRRRLSLLHSLRRSRCLSFSQTSSVRSQAYCQLPTTKHHYGARVRRVPSHSRIRSERAWRCCHRAHLQARCVAYRLQLMILMLFIEIISHIARPISLGIRLMGNMYGDHAVLGVFLGLGCC